MPRGSIAAVKRGPARTLSDAAPPDRVRAAYDAAQVSEETSEHWSLTDSLSAVASLPPQIRARIRNRARYEASNNGFARGAINTLANYVIGTGPRLQLSLGNPELESYLENEFHLWAKRVRLAQKLRLCIKSMAVDGESFTQLVNNPGLNHTVKLDLRQIDCDRVTDPVMAVPTGHADGLVFDDFGNVIAYRVSRAHPGGNYGIASEFDTIRADSMRHLFIADRPEQERGVSRLTPSLNLFGQLRRYRLSVLAASETAADLAGIIKTQQSPEDPDQLDPLDAVDIRRRMLMTLPMGWEVQQMRAEQPTANFSEVSDNYLSEASRPLDMPFNIAAAKSAGYNFASAKLDLMVFSRAVGVDRSVVVDELLDVVLDRWWAEASRYVNYLGVEASDRAPQHDWYWDGDESIDPREAGADATKLANGMMSFAGYYGRRGKDWESEQQAQAKALGLTLDEYRKRLADKLLGPSAADNDNGDTDEDE